MAKELISVVFDRKNALKKVKHSPTAAVEFRIYLNRNCRKFIQFTKCTEREWATVQHSIELKNELNRLNNICQAMILLNEDLTMENLDRLLGLETKVLGSRKEKEEIELAKEDSSFRGLDRTKHHAL